MPAPIDDHTRAAILADIKAKAGSCRGIARKHGVSTETVRNVAKRAGISHPFGRQQTENATRARVADLAARRAVLAEKMLDLSDRLAERITEPCTIYISTREDVVAQTLPEPTLSDARQGMTALGIALDKHLALVKHDADPGTNGARSVLGELGRALGVAAEALDGASKTEQ